MPSLYKKIRLSRTETIDEHRLVMERHLGRKLGRFEVVHHKNEDKRDNRLANLELLSLSEHARQHGLGRVASAETRRKLSDALTGKPQDWHGVLSDEKVRKIRALRASGLGPTAVARLEGVHKCTVIDIDKGRRYARVE